MNYLIDSTFKIFLVLMLCCSVAAANVKDEITPQLNLPDFEGKIHQLNDWQGKTLVLNFWATYCIPCKQEIRDLIKYQEQYEQHGLQVVGIGVNEDHSIKTMSLLLGVNYPMLFADIEQPGNEDILIKWGNNKHMIPYTVVINNQGEIVFRHKGILKKDMFKEDILPLLKIK